MRIDSNSACAARGRRWRGSSRDYRRSESVRRWKGERVRGREGETEEAGGAVRRLLTPTLSPSQALASTVTENKKRPGSPGSRLPGRQQGGGGRGAGAPHVAYRLSRLSSTSVLIRSV